MPGQGAGHDPLFRLGRARSGLGGPGSPPHLGRLNKTQHVRVRENHSTFPSVSLPCTRLHCLLEAECVKGRAWKITCMASGKEIGNAVVNRGVFCVVASLSAVQSHGQMI